METEEKEEEEEEDQKNAGNLLDNLFKKTKTIPCLYWLPLTDEQVCASVSPQGKLHCDFSFPTLSCCSQPRLRPKVTLNYFTVLRFHCWLVFL